MRKVKLQIQMTLDGFVSGPNGELDWMVWKWDDVLKNYAQQLTSSSDSFMVGRHTGEGMAVYWPTVASNPESENDDIVFAQWMNRVPKTVFSKTLTSIGWNNAKVASDIVEEVSLLKQQPGKDILLYGGAGIVSSFIKQGLIDEYHLFVNPVAIGFGKTIFTDMKDMLNLRLIKATTSSVGIVVLFYQPGIKQILVTNKNDES